MKIKICNNPGNIINNTFSTICVWDFNDFDDNAFGGMPDGWYKSQYPFIDYVILMTFTGGKGYNEWCSLENGVSYFANWAYCCDYRNTDEPIIKTSAYFAAQLCNKLCGLPSLECKYTKSESSAVCCVSALDASKNKLYVLLCNHYFERGINSKLSINLKFDGINPSEDCTIYRIDKLHNNFSAKWLEISKHIPRIESTADFDILGSAAETEISKTLAGEGLALWKNFKSNYSFNELTGEKIKFSNSYEILLPSYGVALLEVSVK